LINVIVLFVVDVAEKAMKSVKGKNDNIVVIDLNTPLNTIQLEVERPSPESDDHNQMKKKKKNKKRTKNKKKSKRKNIKKKPEIEKKMSEKEYKTFDIGANHFRSVSLQSDLEAKKRIYGFLYAIAKGTFKV